MVVLQAPPEPVVKHPNCYCLSKTAAVAMGFPSIPVPLVVVFIVFPSAETTVRTVVWYFPPFFDRSSVSVKRCC